MRGASVGLTRTARRAGTRLADIGARCAALPTLDDRAPNDLLDYDEHGLPH